VDWWTNEKASRGGGRMKNIMREKWDIGPLVRFPARCELDVFFGVATLSGCCCV
jgi:hypothetical protein